MSPQSFSTTVVRPQDLLVLVLEFHEVSVVAPQPGQPGRVVGSANARLVVHLPPQHIAEQAFFQDSGFDDPPQADESVLPPGQVAARLAGPSRLAFLIPTGTSIPYTLEGLLEALSQLPLVVPAVSAYGSRFAGCGPLAALLSALRRVPPPAVGPPGPRQTAIEAPYRLYLSPDGQGRWLHAPAPVTHDGRTELWHTRLGSWRDETPAVRAVWSPDFLPDENQPDTAGAFLSSLSARNRNQLVHATSNWLLANFTPLPAAAEQLMLTSLGAWTRLRGDWDTSATANPRLSLEQWRHVMTMGRDHYVRVVTAGYLLPFGHRASLIKITERKFAYDAEADPPGFVAYLYQRFFILVREPVRRFNRHALPFRTVTLKTQVTPDLAYPSEGSAAAIDGYERLAFWPMVRTGDGTLQDVQFAIVATDWQGRAVELSAPLIYVDAAQDKALAATLTEHYNSAAAAGRRTRPLGGQAVAYAPQKKPGDTTLETSELTLAAEHDPGAVPHFWPAMEQARVDIPAVKQLVGRNAVSTIKWQPEYRQATGDNMGNVAQMFAVIDAGPAVTFGAEQSGGLVTPNFSISGLSRVLGPVGGQAADMAAGTFKPQDVFDTGVVLLGGLTLSNIIKILDFPSVSADNPATPQLVTVRDEARRVVTTSYRWILKSSGGELPFVESPLFIPGPATQLSLETVIDSPLNGDPPTFRSAGTLSNFTLVLLAPATPAEDPSLTPELVHLKVESVTFTAEQGKKVDVSVALAGVEFKGILAFVNELQTYIPTDGFSDPPSLDVVTAPEPGIQLGYSLGIPTVGVGIMTMQNLSLGAGLFLPLGSTPLSVRFAFCERYQPFILTVMGLGGGGFMAIDLDLTGVKKLEASMEFGASVALNLGVASGVATIMGGFYFEAVASDVSFTAYLRAYGALSVLGIITVSVEFYLGLTYTPKGDLPHAGTMWGQASLTVKIKLLFFSKSVSVSMEREIAGSDPCFQTMVAPDDWAQYCAAFDPAYPAIGGD